MFPTLSAQRAARRRMLTGQYVRIVLALVFLPLYVVWTGVKGTVLFRFGKTIWSAERWLRNPGPFPKTRVLLIRRWMAANLFPARQHTATYVGEGRIGTVVGVHMWVGSPWAKDANGVQVKPLTRARWGWLAVRFDIHGVVIAHLPTDQYELDHVGQKVKVLTPIGTTITYV